MYKSMYKTQNCKKCYTRWRNNGSFPGRKPFPFFSRYVVHLICYLILSVITIGIEGTLWYIRITEHMVMSWVTWLVIWITWSEDSWRSLYGVDVSNVQDNMICQKKFLCRLTTDKARAGSKVFAIHILWLMWQKWYASPWNDHFDMSIGKHGYVYDMISLAIWLQSVCFSFMIYQVWARHFDQPSTDISYTSMYSVST